MGKAQIISLVLTTLVICILWFAFKFLQLEQMNPTSLRLFVLAAVILLSKVGLIVSTTLKTKRDKIILLCIICLIAVVSMTVCESLIKRIKADRTSIHGTSKGPFYNVEVYLLILYYIVYYGASATFFIGAFFAIIWSMVQGPQQYISDRTFDTNFKDEICPICLADMNNQEQIYAQINICRHMFHQKCLEQWMVHKGSCPLCRKNIYEGAHIVE